MTRTPTGAFVDALNAVAPPERRRRWLFIPEDQLSDRIGPLAREPAADLGIVLIESRWKAALRPWHRHRLALLWANARHFALEQARRGVAVRYIAADTPFADALAPIAADLGPLRVMRPAERELRRDLAPLVARGLVEELPHEGWLTEPDDFRRSQSGPPWRMDRFYRAVRRRTGILIDPDGGFTGGKLSFDTENRKPWRGSPPAPEPPTFEPDAVTREVIDLVNTRFVHHPGSVDPAALPATVADARRLWTWARARCLPYFGPYEDAMSVRSRSLFHTRISALVNLHRLLPRDLIDGALAADIPLPSREGFIRQVLGWREFVRHVHDATDGFRDLPGRPARALPIPGDGGWSRWAGRSWRPPAGPLPDGGALAQSLVPADQQAPLPAAWWGGADAPSGLRCLDQVVASVWDEAWSHHITRLMILGNLATLLDVSVRDLTDWFWCAYADAWDWVVEPNVMAMATFGVGDLMTTKPYVAGAAYIDRMSDFCDGCAFSPGSTCPITPLYWAFLDRHAPRLAANQRLRMPYASLARRSPALRDRDRRVFLTVRGLLLDKRPVTPADLPPPA
ncbi:MAG: cryptochrome/photolyase family protein [Phycisphaerae bacterium]|nr:cryptochrome/photolyase family protein [Phycisphaerae bacterium]